jgi:hypothetical protein
MTKRENVPDLLIDLHVAGLTDAHFPSNRVRHYFSLLKYERNPNTYAYSFSSINTMGRAISTFMDAEVISAAEQLYVEWKVSARLPPFA